MGKSMEERQAHRETGFLCSIHKVSRSLRARKRENTWMDTIINTITPDSPRYGNKTLPRWSKIIDETRRRYLLFSMESIWSRNDRADFAVSPRGVRGVAFSRWPFEYLSKVLWRTRKEKGCLVGGVRSMSEVRDNEEAIRDIPIPTYRSCRGKV